MLEVTRNVAERARSTIGVTIQNLAIQDVIALAFHGYLFLRVTIAPDSPDATVARRLALALLVVTACSMVLTRGEVIRGQRARALTYRLGLFVPMVLSYFELRVLLPALQPDLMDHRLFAIDLWLLGTTPSVWMEPWNTKPVVEWLSFFYYTHFFVLIVMLVPALFFGKGRRLQELMAGGMLVIAAGHFLYTLVPGVGPYATLAFAEPLHGGFWWTQVEVTVATAGAQLDIFPSLHTAWPAYFTLHAFANRDYPPFRVFVADPRVHRDQHHHRDSFPAVALVHRRRARVAPRLCGARFRGRRRRPRRTTRQRLRPAAARLGTPLAALGEPARIAQERIRHRDFGGVVHRADSASNPPDEAPDQHERHDRQEDGGVDERLTVFLERRGAGRVRRGRVGQPHGRHGQGGHPRAEDAPHRYTCQ